MTNKIIKKGAPMKESAKPKKLGKDTENKLNLPSVIKTKSGKEHQLDEKLFEKCVSERDVSKTADYLTNRMDNIEKFICVNDNYFEVLNDGKLKNRKRTELDYLYGDGFCKNIVRYIDFCMEPDNINFKKIHSFKNGEYYNLASPPLIKPSEIAGEWPSIEKLLRHVFETQYELGLEYMRELYINPKQKLPIIVLLSRLRGTGKTTYLNLNTQLYEHSSIIISPDDLSGSFNAIFADKNIIMIDEAVIEKTQTVEKLKSYSTQRSMTVKKKYVNDYQIPFYGKFILATNKEEDFAKIDDEENRFWVLKLKALESEDFDLLEKIETEIPFFLKYLIDRKATNKRGRLFFDPSEYKTEQLNVVKQYSRNWLYKEMKEKIADFFYSNTSLKEFRASSTDLQLKFFLHNKDVTLNFIGRTLKDEFKKTKSYKKDYWAFGTETPKAGQTWLFERAEFIESEEEQEEEEKVEIQNTKEDWPY